LQHLGWLKTLSHNIGRFDNTLFGFIDLGKPALSSKTGVYLPGMVLVIGSAVIQFFQSKQLMPQSTEQKGLRDILKSASDGKQADQSEVNAAVTRSTRYFLPVFIFIFTVHLASALSLYWLTGGLIAFIQQSYALRQDESEMEALADKPVKKDVSNIEEAEVVKKPAKKTTAPNSSKKAKRRRSKR
jgi:membrane protein insertase Oxa1/YidC/SpoIIIJ